MCSSDLVPKDFKSQYGFFGGETWLWPAKSGKIWALVRVDSNELPIKDRPIKAGNDQADHFILFSSEDEGKTFDRIRDFGDYGEMYMRLVCRPYVFTASLPPSVVATAATSIRKLMDA